jgi:hypothetical protein
MVMAEAKEESLTQALQDRADNYIVRPFDTDTPQIETAQDFLPNFGVWGP